MVHVRGRRGRPGGLRTGIAEPPRHSRSRLSRPRRTWHGVHELFHGAPEGGKVECVVDSAAEAVGRGYATDVFFARGARIAQDQHLLRRDHSGPQRDQARGKLPSGIYQERVARNELRFGFVRGVFVGIRRPRIRRPAQEAVESGHDRIRAEPEAFGGRAVHERVRMRRGKTDVERRLAAFFPARLEFRQKVFAQMYQPLAEILDLDALERGRLRLAADRDFHAGRLCLDQFREGGDV